MRALVTAIGGDLGQAVARALARHGVGIVACDSESLHEWVTSGVVGVGGVSRFARVPLARDATYRNTLSMLADAWDAEVLVPCSEQEILALGEDAPQPALMLEPVPLAARLFDKWETAELARKHKLPFARTAPEEQAGYYTDGEGCRCGYGGFPWEPEVLTVYKPRRKHGEQEVAQERLEGPEYTVAVWRGHETRALALRRELRGGATYRAWYDPNSKETMRAELTAMNYADVLGLHGSFNVQGRYVAGRGFIPFEVNPRFSSTVSMRDSMGFCDAWWSLQEALGLPVDNYKRPARSRAVRYWAEAAQVDGEWR